MTPNDNHGETTMASLTIKDIPEDLLERLRELAEEDRRSMTQEVIYLLAEIVSEYDAKRSGRARADRQADDWEQLAGRWKSDKSADEEIGEIYDSRTRGRQVDL